MPARHKSAFPLAGVCLGSHFGVRERARFCPFHDGGLRAKALRTVGDASFQAREPLPAEFVDKNRTDNQGLTTTRS